MIASSTSRFDIARFGAEVFRQVHARSDLMIVAGTVTQNGAVAEAHLGQMPDPNGVSLWSLLFVGGPFNTYAVLQGVDKIVPVDVYVTGCPRGRRTVLRAAQAAGQNRPDDHARQAAHRGSPDESMLEEFKQQFGSPRSRNPA